MMWLSEYERRGDKLAPLSVFLRRLWRNALVVFFFIALSLAIGTVGYHFIGEVGWLDAFLNASMILTGMGPVNEMKTPAAKVFSGLYALYSGITFLTLVAFLMAPVYHRLLHHFHLPTESDEDQKDHKK